MRLDDPSVECHLALPIEPCRLGNLDDLDHTSMGRLGFRILLNRSC